MGLRRFVFDLPQVSNWLNQEKLDSEKVTPEELKTWAEAGCFPVEKKGEFYRVTQDSLPLVEETKHLIKTEDYTIEEAKSILQKTFKEKEAHFERMERQELPSPEVLLLMEHYYEETNQNLQETGNGLLMGLVDTESSLKEYTEETLRESEERIKGAIIHAEVRMKTVLERVEKRMCQHIENLLQNNTQSPSSTQDELELLIQRHQEELLGLTQKHEEELENLKETLQKEYLETSKQHEKAYEELLHAGFFKRIKLKKEWKQKK